MAATPAVIYRLEMDVESPLERLLGLQRERCKKYGEWHANIEAVVAARGSRPVAEIHEIMECMQHVSSGLRSLQHECELALQQSENPPPQPARNEPCTSGAGTASELANSCKSGGEGGDANVEGSGEIGQLSSQVAANHSVPCSILKRATKWIDELQHLEREKFERTIRLYRTILMHAKQPGEANVPSCVSSGAKSAPDSGDPSSAVCGCIGGVAVHCVMNCALQRFLRPHAQDALQFRMLRDNHFARARASHVLSSDDDDNEGGEEAVCIAACKRFSATTLPDFARIAELESALSDIVEDIQCELSDS